jgi:predicted PurR-regulated permease PerM
MVSDKVRSERETLLVTLVLFLLSAVVLYPFLDSILLAVFVSYMLRFAHIHINKYLDNDMLSSMIVVSGVLITITVFLYVFINNFFEILTQFNQFTGSLRQGVVNVVDMLNLSQEFQTNLRTFLGRISDMATDSLISTFTSIPTLLIDVAIFLVTTLFLYKDRERLESQFHRIMKNVPEPERGIIKTLLGSIDDIFRGVFITQFIVAFILAIVTAVGFVAISELTTPIPFIPLWSILVGIAALLPLVAAFMFYGPISIYYFTVGQPFKATLILVFGIVVINVLSEIFLRPYVGSKQMDEHPLVIFLGFLAGPLALGVKGIILGPLLLILTKEFVMNYASEPYAQHSGNHSEDTDQS